jgi:transposase, IS5 family
MGVRGGVRGTARIVRRKPRAKLSALRNRVHHRANRDHPLSQAQENANRRKSRVRARIEHVFGS